MAIPTADSDLTADSGVLTADVGPHSILHIWVMADLVAPSVPTALAATPVSETQINLAWQASRDLETGVAAYRVYADGVQVAQLNALTFQHTGLAAYSSHGYAVSAVDAAGNESARSAVVNARTLDTTAPSVPAGLVASPVSENEIDLSWSAASDTGSGLSGYRVYRDGAFLAQVATLTHHDTGCAAYSQHSYAVSAIDVAGNESAQSAAVQARSLDTTAPSVPASLTATPVSSSEIDLAWNPSTDAGSGVSQYRVYRGATLIATTAVRAVQDTGLTSATQYSYTVAATDNAGNVSAQCGAVSATTLTTGGGAFDFFIAPGGNDSALGTSPGTAWSLSAFNSSTLRSQYAGKKIGLVGDRGPFQFSNSGSGQVSIYSQVGALGGGPPCIFQIQGGTAGAPTYVASCDSNGVYQPRYALIDCRDPATSAYPKCGGSGNGGGGVLGQSDASGGGPAPTVYGNVTIDAISMRGFCYAGLLFRNNGTIPLPNLVIKNCEIYDNIGGVAGGVGSGLPSNNNPGGIHLTAAAGGNATVINNCVHDCYTDSSAVAPLNGYSGFGMYAIELITWEGSLQVSNNTCYNAGAGIGLKDTFNGYGSIDHNYCDQGIFGSGALSAAGYFGAIAFLCPGFQKPTLSVTNNICLGYISARGAGGGSQHQNYGVGVINNNTIYVPPGSNLAAFALQSGVLQAGATHPAGTWEWKGNLVYFANGGYQAGGTRGCVCFDWWNHGETGITAASSDYNWYGANGAGCQFAVGTTNMNKTFAQFQTLTSCDAHSTYSALSPFAGTPVPLDPSSFVVNPTAATQGPGGGPVGATGTIGADFALITIGTVPAATVGQAYAGVTLTANGVGPFSWQLISAAPNWLRVWGTEGDALGTGQTLTFGQGVIPQNVETDAITVACTDANGVKQVTFNIIVGHQ